MDTALLLSPIAAFVASWSATGLLIRYLRQKMLDVPNERSSHATPTPRGGGLGVIVGVAAALGLRAAAGGAASVPLAIALGAAAMAALGLADDYFRLSSRFRLVVQTAIAIAVVLVTGGIGSMPAPAPLSEISLGAFDVPLTVFWLVAVVNLYNFLDGIDGFAAGQGLVAALLLAMLFSDSASSVYLLDVAGACAGFLLHNWNPAAVFLGDVGSCFLGFVFASAPLALETSGRGMGVFVVALALWFFLADGAYAVFSRGLRGERIWEAHRSHFYQRLTRTGLSHGRTVLLVAGFFTPLAAAMLWAGSRGGGFWWGAFAVAIASFGLYSAYLARRERILALDTATPSIGDEH